MTIYRRRDARYATAVRPRLVFLRDAPACRQLSILHNASRLSGRAVGMEGDDGVSAADALRALRALRFVVGTRCTHIVCVGDHSDRNPYMVDPATWEQLLHSVGFDDALNASALLWLAGEEGRSPGAPLPKALLGLVPLPGLAAAAPELADGRLPSATLLRRIASSLPEVRGTRRSAEPFRVSCV